MTTTPASLSASFLAPSSGFHFNYKTRSQSQIPSPGCALHLRYLLPPDLYVDPHELQDHFSSPFWVNSTINLELPLGTENTSSGLELQLFLTPGVQNPVVSISLPVHARYGRLSATSHHTIVVPQPTGTWLCPASGQSLVLPALPLEPAPLSVSSTVNPGSVSVQLPVATVAQLSQVELGTAALMSLLFIYLSSAFCATAHRLYSLKMVSKSS